MWRGGSSLGFEACAVAGRREIGRHEGIREASSGSERECQGEGAGGGLSFAINIVSLD